MRYMKFEMASLLLITALAGCARDHRYPLRGEVVAKDIGRSEITVNHEDIPGFMSAMIMPYHVKSPAVVQELQPGDKIAADVVVNAKDRSDYWLDDVRITDETGRGKANPTPQSQMLGPGQPAPDVTLINQDGKKIKLSDFAGKALLITFIYTRCPMPNFCPRLSSQFAHIHNDLKKNAADYGKTHLLSVSFDPKYDTAEVLRKYGLGYLQDDATGFAQWDFASADPENLHRLAQAFGLEYDEQDNQFSHTMNIVLIAPDGKVAKYWSSDWTTAELTQNLQQAAHGQAPSGGS